MVQYKQTNIHLMGYKEKYTLGDILEPEKLEIEYKTFTIRDSDDYFETDDLIRIVSGYIDNPSMFNLMIQNNLEYYCQKYLPRYLSVFGNSTLSSGKLIIGIDDSGEISGIPMMYQTGSNIKGMIKSTIDSVITDLKYYVKTDNIEELIDRIEYEIDECQIEPNFLDEEGVEKIIEEKNRVITDHQKLWNHYMLKKSKWLKMVRNVNTTMVRFANHPKLRGYVIDFLTDPTKLESNPHFYGSTEHTEMINLLQSSVVIEINYSTIEIDANNPKHLIYWIGKCKDYHSELVQKLRPPKVPNHIFSCPYRTEVNLLRRLRQILTTKNKNQIRYYTITFNLPTSNPSPVLFRNPKNIHWLYKIRMTVNNQPGCL